MACNFRLRMTTKINVGCLTFTVGNELAVIFPTPYTLTLWNKCRAFCFSTVRNEGICIHSARYEAKIQMSGVCPLLRSDH